MIEIQNRTEVPDSCGNFFGLHVLCSTSPGDCAAHWHTDFEILTPLSGTCTAIVNDAQYSLNAGDLLFINSCELHAFHAPTHGEHVVLRFDKDLLSSLKDLDILLFLLASAVKISPSQPGPLLYKDVSGLLHQILKEYESGNALKGPLIYSFLIQLYLKLCEKFICGNENFQNTSLSKQKEYTERFLQTCRYINQHYKENLTLEQTAEYAGFSKFHFLRLFKQFTNMTFNEYVNLYRIRAAKELLADPSLSVLETAKASGFSSLSNFNRAFRQCCSCSPSEYRKKYERKTDE